MPSFTMLLKRTLRKFGIDVIRYDAARYPAVRRRMLMQKYGTNLVLDVGANVGQYASQTRNCGYHGKIISFEPMKAPYRELCARAAKDNNWETHNFALGESNGELEIHISGNSISSSIRDMRQTHLESAPTSGYVGLECIRIKLLDEIFSTICNVNDKVWLKIDTQGYEKNVLDGARDSLRRIDTIQLELSLVELYEGQALFPELYQYLAELGYSLVAIDPGFQNKATGQLLQFDGTFHRFGVSGV